jgi:hypothetical protein
VQLGFCEEFPGYAEALAEIKLPTAVLDANEHRWLLAVPLSTQLAGCCTTEMFADPEFTVKLTPLLATPPAAVTTTFPVVAPLGTVTPMLVFDQLPDVTVAVVPLNVTVPWLDPKFVPVIVTEAPTAPELVDRPLMLGAPVTVKLTPLLDTPPEVVTTTFPVVAPVGTCAVMLLAVHELI